MKKLFSRTKNTLGRKLRSWKAASRSERGQVLVVVTIAMLVLVAFVGLTADVGLLYIEHGKLRRAVDAAALAASSEFRKGYTYPTGHLNLENAAREFLKLNGYDPDDEDRPYTPRVETCVSAEAAGDEAVKDILNCDGPTKRKLVWVEASTTMETSFLKVIGIQEVPLRAQAVSEAASLDVVLAIDTSESMTWDAEPLTWQRDPYQCNPGNDCQPFRDVKEAAKAFVDQLFFPYDRVSIVTFDQTARYVLHFSDDPLKNNATYIKGKIQDLTVFSPETCVAAGGGPCREYERYTDDPLDGDGHGDGDGDWSDELIIDESPADGIGDTYLDFRCPELSGYGASYPANDNAHPCGSTNIGAGLRYAGNEFAGATTANPPPNPPITIRTESLWAVILLSDGAANSSYGIEDYCVSDENPICRDKWADTRHCASAGDVTCLARGGVFDLDAYDVNDFAKDMADFIFDDQQALIFTIGLGPDVLRKQGVEFACDPGSPDYNPTDCERADNGEKFLQYAADPDGDETPFGGEYYYAPDGNDLRQIFLDIADKLATRLTQ
ncbi:MAG: pilus assembly protein TadG-related protein [Chloroflexota bacterium]